MSSAFRFGTAGIRATLGAGPNQLNRESVRVIAHAIMEELGTFAPDPRERGISLAFDGRHESRAFAQEVAGVALAAGFRVFLFERETPTPLLAFAVRTLNNVAGIMITASHNPARDNGIKLYLEGGRQISTPHDAQIEAGIAASPPASEIASADLEAARRSGQLRSLGDAQRAAYVSAVRRLTPPAASAQRLRVGYTALYGVGSETVHQLCAGLPGLELVEVRAEAELRADFGGLASPNPEEATALRGLLALMEEEQLSLAFANDPDADRLAVVAREPGAALRALSGDEVGALLGDFLLSQHPAPGTTLLASTLVSGGLLEQVAAAHGAAFVRAPTGFKWIAALGREQAAARGRELLFGYEEALGYAFFSMADDKDGLAALAVLCVMAQRLAAEGRSLLDQLATLETTHGVFVTRQLSVHAPEATGKERIARALAALRALSAEQLLGANAQLRDYEREARGTPLLIFSNALQTRVCVRPSGTEPKLKIYLHTREPVTDAEDLRPARVRALQRLDALEQALAPLLAAP